MASIQAKRLTTFSVTADGSSVAIGVADDKGESSALILPADCLQAMMITLPEMMRQLLRQQFRDPNLRLVYPVGGWELEASTEPCKLILTLRTPDGFHVSFAVAPSDLERMAATATLADAPGGTADAMRPH